MPSSESPSLVTGATGFIGGHLAERLLAMGQPLRLLVRDPSRLSPLLRNGAEIIQGNLEDADSLLPAVQGARRIFHCAANVRTWDLPQNYHAVNVAGLGHLLGAIEQTGQRPHRFVHLSSVDVYGFPKTPCNEDCPTNGSDFAYGQSKLQGELLLREQAARMHLPYSVLRPTNVMGARSPFIQRIGDELRRGLMLTIHGGVEDCGFLAVDNLVDGMLWAAQAEAALGQCYNVADPEAISWRRFLDDFRAGIQGKGVILDLPYGLANAVAAVIEAPYRWLGSTREPLLHRILVRIFGRTCGHRADRIAAVGCPVGRVSYAQAMRESIAWYRESGAGA